MTQDHDDNIRLRPDGSIDTGYYMKIGRDLRSEQAHAMARSLWFGRGGYFGFVLPSLTRQKPSSSKGLQSV
jgi:hypothetical protein